MGPNKAEKKAAETAARLERFAREGRPAQNGADEQPVSLSPSTPGSPARTEEPSLTDLLLQIKDVCTTLITAKTEELKVEFSILKHDIQKLRERTVEAEQCISSLENSYSPLPQQLQNLQQAVAQWQTKADDLENRLLGFPEWVEGPNPETFLENWIRDTFQVTNLSSAFTIERAHRIPMRAPIPGAPPRALIARLLNAKDRDSLLAMARAKGHLTYENAKISLYPDFSQETQKQRSRFQEVKKRLRDQKLEYSMLYPARLRIQSNGTTYFFTTPPLSILSWNVRGLNDQIKRKLVLDYVKKQTPEVIMLQETHLQGSKTLALKRPWVGWAFHSTFSTYTGGVATLIKRTANFKLLTLQSDPQGRFLLIHCYLNMVETILANIYIPPPYTDNCITQLATFIATHPHARVIATGDFNTVLDEQLDRLRKQNLPGLNKPSNLHTHMENLGLTEIWRHTHPTETGFSCFSTSHMVLSRIDMAFISKDLLLNIHSATYLARGISDHAPLQLIWNARYPPQRRNKPWSFNPVWLNIINNDQGLADTFKAYLRGLLHSEITAIKRASTKRKQRIQNITTQLQVNPSYQKLQFLRQLEATYNNCLQQKARRSLLFNRANFFEHSERAGKLLAYISRTSEPPPIITELYNTQGQLVTQTEQIKETLHHFYQNLYTSQQRNTREEINRFLTDITLPTLPQEFNETLIQDITETEIYEAIKAFPPRKAAGSDGLPIEIYQRFHKELTPHLTKLYNNALTAGTLPPSLYNATIVLLSKPGKDPKYSDSYRPISLLTTDIKILAKVLANSLGKVILQLVHEDQTGFMPGKSTAPNIRRLYTNLTYPHSNTGQRTIVALDIAKAFDTVEWSYLWLVMEKFGIGQKYINMVKLLYNSPNASIRINGELTLPFTLGRGTRQGCPLSPLLFALAMEPFAQHIRSHPTIKGLRIGPIEERIQLYADDTLLYLGDRGNSVQSAMTTIHWFGCNSGLITNNSKSMALLIDPPGANEDLSTFPFKIVSQLTYLGVNIALPITRYTSINIDPMINWLQSKLKTWSSLPLGPMGRIHLIKMLVLPKLLYTLQQSPTWVPRINFVKLNSLFRLIWANSRCRLKLDTLMRSKSNAGTSFPDMYLKNCQIPIITKKTQSDAFGRFVSK
uniref:Reverse transcriptase domain-containing protein n=1 Tax=Xenopus tropicalis TaxID=8364 RepID=A0A803JST4_XENTR